jgi:hypothetical protein
VDREPLISPWRPGGGSRQARDKTGTQLFTGGISQSTIITGARMSLREGDGVALLLYPYQSIRWRPGMVPLSPIMKMVLHKRRA